MNLIFDYDGTIHNSITIYRPAFERAYEYLTSLGLAKERSWNELEIARWLGYSSKEMWDIFMPSLSKYHKEKCSQIIGETMLKLIDEGRAQLYTHSTEVLQQLKQSGYRLVFLSNCKRSYMNAHMKYFDLEKYFSSFYCTEDFDFKPKYIIFDKIKKDHDGEFIVIGDRYQDMEIALKHNLKAIGCIYGYGNSQELAFADMLVSEVKEILALL
ncbi:HAD family hydrolase [Sedimentibacter sp. MB31-C6]|uniref:HAD family hydrolase n=1 Tax=Sedimentibacter sp. MB31-C6 TaxID=3109366 RepID=UPI002DDD4C0E|nr:HAD family hydrolase [Sedimentibacter sp. MB36-C1]WSI03641.1 HAD family hydrolase [Sedimentibacter sp. MB36-C1]